MTVMILGIILTLILALGSREFRINKWVLVPSIILSVGIALLGLAQFEISNVIDDQNSFKDSLSNAQIVILNTRMEYLEILNDSLKENQQKTLSNQDEILRLTKDNKLKVINENPVLIPKQNKVKKDRQ